jgi:hypothetical protein
MFADFITHFHKNEIKIDEEKLKDLYKEFYGAIATKSWTEKHAIRIDYFDDKKIEKAEDVTNPAIILEKWKSYEYGPIHYSKKFHDETDKLNHLIASPLMPTELRSKLEEFNRFVSNNLYTVGKVLNDIAQELPQKFPTANSLKKFEPGGIWNRYNREKKVLEPKAKEILTYIRQYLKIDKLVE